MRTSFFNPTLLRIIAWNALAAAAFWFPIASSAQPGDVTQPSDPILLLNGVNDGDAYRLTFPTLKNAADANALRIGEVEVLGAMEPPRVLRCFALCESNKIHVLYDRPVQLNGIYTLEFGTVNGVSYGSSESEVLVDIEPLPLDSTGTLTIQGVHNLAGGVIEPNPTSCTFYFGFGRFCADWRTPAGHGFERNDPALCMA